MIISNEGQYKPRLLEKLPFFLLALMVLIGVFAPRFFAFGPEVVALIALFLWRFSYKSWPRVDLKLMGFMLALCGITAISSFWAIDADGALDRAWKNALIFIPMVILASMAKQWPHQASLVFVKYLPFLCVISGVICVIDLYLNGAFYYLTRDVPADNFFNRSLINRGVNVFLLMSAFSLFTMFVTQYWCAARRMRARKYLCGILVCMVLAVMYQTHSQTGQAGVMIVVFVGSFFPVARKSFFSILAAILVLGIFLAPWIAQMMFEYLADGVHADPSTLIGQAYMADRMEIWDYIARKALENPLYGFGVEAARAIDHFDTAMLYTPTDHILHPHNFILQLWIELGVIGAFIAAVFCLYILHAIWRIEDLNVRRFALAIYLAIFFMACTSYGIWQGWWLGLMGYAGVMMNILHAQPKIKYEPKVE